MVQYLACFQRCSLDEEEHAWFRMTVERVEASGASERGQSTCEERREDELLLTRNVWKSEIEDRDCDELDQTCETDEVRS